jgi:hypothetical protein
MKYREIFEGDKGHRFYRHRVSVLVQAITYGRRLDGEQLSKYVANINVYLDGISGRTRAQYNDIAPLSRTAFPQVKVNSFYKYVSDETLGYTKRGSFQFGTAQFYRNSDNAKIRDEREGASTFHIGFRDNQVHVSVISGFNCAIFCGVADRAHTDEKLMRSRFGRNLLVIKDLKKFATRACSLLGAKKVYIYDVIYSDLKNYVLEMDGVVRFHEITGSGMNNKALHEINQCFFQAFYDASFMPSLFSKPTRYAPERERRIIFEMNEDIQSPTIVIEDGKLLELVELI